MRKNFRGKDNIASMSTNIKKFNIAVIPGDGIGKEVTPQAQAVLEKATEGIAEFSYTDFDLGAERYLRDGQILPENELEEIKKHDAVLLGAVGDPRVKAGVLERGLLLKLRFELDLYVNLRPSKLYKGVASPLANPGDIDFVVVREGTEGLYCGSGGNVRTDTPNVVHAGDMWQRITDRVAKEFPEVKTDYLHVDAATIFIVNNPSQFDVIVTDNLFGDILTDECGAIVGGIGYSASGCINAANEYPSMFEPVHGSAPDIAGQGIANPTAAILSDVLLLRHLRLEEPAARIEAAVEKDIENLGNTKRTTEQVGKDILANL